MGTQRYRCLLAVFLASALFLTSGCWYSERKGFVNSAGKVQGYIFGGIRGKTLEFAQAFYDHYKWDMFFHDEDVPDYLAHLVYDLDCYSMFTSMIAEAIIDPLVLQLPADATAVSVAYNDYQGHSGSMVVQAGLASIPVTPGVFLTPEPGQQLVLIDFPEGAAGLIPNDSQPEHWFEFSYSFQLSSSRDVTVKCMQVGKMSFPGQTYYIPLLPPSPRMADAMAITITRSGSPKDLVLPTNQQIPVPYSGTATYDFSPLSTYRYFPRLAYTPGVTTEGFGFVNTGDSAVSVTYTARRPTGEILAVSSPVQYPPHGQAANQAESLLGLPAGEEAGGWVSASCSDPTVKGFFLSQWIELNQLIGLDGAPVLTRTTRDGLLPRVRGIGSYDTELFVANPANHAITVQIAGADGIGTRDGGSHEIAAYGVYQTTLKTLFPEKTVFDGSLQVQSPDGDFFGNALVRHNGGSLSSLNFMPLSDAATVLYASHIVLYPGIYFTELNLVNPFNVDAPIILYPYNADGSPMGAQFHATIPANQKLTLRDTELGLPEGVNSDGWLKVESEGPPILGSLTFGNPVDNHYESTLPLQAVGALDTHFAQVARGPVGGVEYFTGVSILNPQTSAVTVTIEVHASDSSLLGQQVNRVLQPGEKYVRLLEFIEGIGTLPNQSSGYLRVTATAPVFAYELFGDVPLNFMSAVPAQP